MSQREEVSQRVARELLRIGAVVFSPGQPFTWASGIKSPIYVDNRLTMSHPGVRRVIADGFAAIIEEERLEVDAIVGTATAGIPHAAWLADVLDLPMAYVRGSAKQHGRRNKVEGRLDPGARVVVIEDLVSTGGSSLEAVHALRDMRAEVVAVMAIFTYGLRAASIAFKEAGIPLHTLSDFRAVVAAAREDGSLTDDDVEMLQVWHRQLSAGSSTDGD
ncbi:MAG: orotate phosphoribosyltransferase [Rhodothermales bacterium]|nr:orotate phosphoribosyltransferase [Rhodothermales bacterium]